MSVTVEDDGSIRFSDTKGQPVPEAVIALAKKTRGNAVRDLLQTARDKVNRKVEALKELHLHAPPPCGLTDQSAKVFALKKPVCPIAKEPGIFASLSETRVEQIEWENTRTRALYLRARRHWELNRAKFEHEELLRAQRLKKVLGGDCDSIELHVVNVLHKIPWPMEMAMSLQSFDDGNRLAMEVSLPSINDMPCQTASLGPRGDRLILERLDNAQVKSLYTAYVHSVFFRLVAESFANIPTAQEVFLSGYLSSPDREGSNEGRGMCIMSLQVKRAGWSSIDFTNIELLNIVEVLEQFERARDMAAQAR